MHSLYATDKLEMPASPILPSENLNMSYHESISGILRFLSSILSFCYRHLSTIFFSLDMNYMGHSHFLEQTIKVTLQKLPSFVKRGWGWSVKLSAEVSSLPHVPCLLWITASTRSVLQRLGTENRKETSEPALPGAKQGRACFPLDGDFKAIASGLRIIPWIYLKSWF